MKTNRLIALVLVLIVALSLCLTSCEDEKNKDLAKLNELAAKLDGNYTLVINVKSDNGNVSNKEYTVSDENGKKTVYAKIETLNKFDVSGGEITPPESYSTVTEGYLTEAEIAKGNFELPEFKFTSSNITIMNNNIMPETTLVGKVNSLTELMGKTFDASDVKLSVVYTENAIKLISISFTSSQSYTVTLTYTF